MSETSRSAIISTHDLAKRSTAQIYKLKQEQLFQLTTSRGGRRRPRSRSREATTYFNSRPHKEVDLNPVNMLLLTAYFNSRPHKEVDHQIQDDLNSIRISTHDLTRRSTLGTLALGCYNYISTHDLTRRSTAIFTQKVFLSKSLFVLIAYNIFILY